MEPKRKSEASRQNTAISNISNENKACTMEEGRLNGDYNRTKGKRLHTSRCGET